MRHREVSPLPKRRVGTLGTNRFAEPAPQCPQFPVGEWGHAGGPCLLGCPHCPQLSPQETDVAASGRQSCRAIRGRAIHGETRPERRETNSGARPAGLPANAPSARRLPNVRHRAGNDQAHADAAARFALFEMLPLLRGRGRAFGRTGVRRSARESSRLALDSAAKSTRLMSCDASPGRGRRVPVAI